MSQRRSSRLMANSINSHHHHHHPNPNYFPLSNQRHYSFDAADTHLAPFANMNVDYDAADGAGGVSVSSYESIDDDHNPVDVQAYSPYHDDPLRILYSSKKNHTPPTDQMLPYSTTTHSIYPPVPYATEDLNHAPAGALTPSDVSSSISPPNGQIGNTKYSTSIPGDRIASALAFGQQQQQQLDDPVNRHAAEEDRRRRNTAASARFRMKKKQREQTLERSVRETAERNTNLEARVTQLEMENRWLKNLVTEKHEATTARLAIPRDDGSSTTTPTTATGVGGGSSSATKDSSNSAPNSNRRANGIPGSGQKHIQPKKKGVGTVA